MDENECGAGDVTKTKGEKGKKTKEKQKERKRDEREGKVVPTEKKTMTDEPMERRAAGL